MKRKMEEKLKWVWEVILGGAGAAMLIGLGDYALLKVGEPVGPVLFSFGLLGVCVLNLRLFTGKCGFLFEDKLTLSELGLVLLSNLVFGYLFGMLMSIADGEVLAAATEKVGGWVVNDDYLIRAVLCGMIMYLAVKLYRKGTNLGILLGVPLFIFSGMQHSIANVITLGMTMNLEIRVTGFVMICVVGNFIGAILAWFLTRKVWDREEDGRV